MAAKYEDQTDCFGNSDCIDPNNSPLGMPWFQLWKVRIFLEEAFQLANQKLLRLLLYGILNICCETVCSERHLYPGIWHKET